MRGSKTEEGSSDVEAPTGKSGLTQGRTPCQIIVEALLPEPK